MRARNWWLLAAAVPLLALLFTLVPPVQGGRVRRPKLGQAGRTRPRGLMKIHVTNLNRRPRRAKGCTWTQRADMQNFANPIYFNVADKNVVPPSGTKKERHHEFYVPAGTELVVACPGSTKAEISQQQQFSLGEDYNSFTAKCLPNSGKFGIEFFDGVKSNDDLGAYVCENSINFNDEDFSNQAACPFPLISRGYSVTNSAPSKSFRYDQLTICYDKAEKRTIYVKHKWLASEAKPAALSTGWKSIKFNDKSGLEALYDTDWHKGHLAPAADFKLRTLKLATYVYENAAPQLGCLNSGQWKLMEDEIRKDFKTATIYTGTLGEGTRNNQNKDERNNLKFTEVPRPLVFWKIAFGYDKKHQKTIKGFLFLNGIGATEELIRNIETNFESDHLYRDVMGVTKGYRFDEKDEVSKMLNRLPDFDQLKKLIMGEYDQLGRPENSGTSDVEMADAESS